MTTTQDPFLAMLTVPSNAAPRRRKSDYSPGLSPQAHIEDLKREEAEREKRRELIRAPIDDGRDIPPALDRRNLQSIEPSQSKVRPDFADDIDAKVAAMVRAGDVVWEQSTSEYRAPWCRRFKFG